MFKLFWTSLLMFAGIFFPCEGECGEVPAAERAVLEALAQESDAWWNAADADRLAAMFAEDADLRLGNGPHQLGREGVLDYFARSFAAREPNLRHTTELTALNEVAPGVVVADGHVRLERIGADGEAVLLRRFVNHTVLVKEDGVWRFKAIRAHVLATESPAS